MGRENPLALWSASISTAVSSRGSLWVPQLLLVLQFVLQAVAELQHTWRSCFFSQESQAALWWVFHGTEFGREKHLQPPSPAWQAYPACCSVVKQLVQASVEVLCVELLM